MAKGFHSRSPEELKKYLQELNTKPKRKNWIQFFILADIIILLFIFYMISKKITPDMEIQYKPSNKILTPNYELYFARSNEQEKESSSYFIFIKNLKNTTINFPAKNERLVFILNKSNFDCIQKNIEFEPKKILVGKREFINFTIKHDEIKDTEECKRFYEKKDTRSWRNIMADKNIKFIPELNLVDDKQIYKMRIE